MSEVGFDLGSRGRRVKLDSCPYFHRGDVLSQE